MASLYIKNSATAARVERLARQRGTTKTALIGEALDALEKRTSVTARPSHDGDAAPTDPVEWLVWHRARHPLPPKVGEADKAFFDRLWGEPD